MPSESSPVVEPILPDSVPRVARFLNLHLNSRLSTAEWNRAIRVPWPSPMSNHGFMLTRNTQVMGAGLAFYSSRTIAGRDRSICNLGALCVLPEARMHTIRLIRAALKQPGLDFTDLSPSGNVVELNGRLGFHMLDTTTYLTINGPYGSDRNVRLLCRTDDIDREINAGDRGVFDSHRRAGAARHLLAVRGNEQCYVIFRHDRRKGLPLFASILYVSNRNMFGAIASRLGAHLLTHHRVPITLSEPRVTGVAPRHGWKLARPRPKMFRSSVLSEATVDYLFSELVCVPW